MSDSYYAADSADIIGDVRLGKNSSVWYQSVLRGDSTTITVGEGSNIQDGCIVHGDADYPVVVGKNVTVGHGVILHGCVIGDNTTIGMGSILLNGCRIGKNCMIGAGSLVPQHKEIPDNTLAFGSPAAVKKTMTDEQIENMKKSGPHYIKLAKDQLNEKPCCVAGVEYL